MSIRMMGRLVAKDDRDKDYPMSALVPQESEREDRTYRYWWAEGWRGNQGSTPFCVAFAWDHWTEDGPTTHYHEGRDIDPEYMDSNQDPLFDPAKLYHECQRRDRWPGECVDKETSCLCKSKGWIGPDELEVGDEILTFDMESETTTWGVVQKVHQYDDRPYRVWGHRGFEAAVTDNHKWPVNSRVRGGSYQLVETQNWKSQHQFPRSAPSDELPEESNWSDEFVKLVAWVMTEGHYRPESRKGNGIVISQKGDHVDHIQSLLEENGCEVEGSVDDIGTWRWEISGDLSDKIREVAPNRAPSIEWLSSLTFSQLDMFIDEAIKGDGCVTTHSGNRKSRVTFSQKTGPILDSFLAACSLAGRPISRIAEGKGSNSNVEHWGFRQSNQVRVRKLSELDQRSGLVWCPQTQYGTFVARRGSSMFITGNSYDGTSVRAGAKVLKDRGVISEYRWAWDLETVVDTILHVGPVVVGTWWYKDMFYPDSDNFIEIGGRKVGGHAYVLNGVSTEDEKIRIKNSWGLDWGDRGHAYIRFDDMAQLIDQNGEACIATEKHLEEYQD